MVRFVEENSEQETCKLQFTLLKYSGKLD